MRRHAPLTCLFAALLLSGCLFGSPSASPSPSTASSVASAGASGSIPPVTATPAPTPGPDAVPTFTAGTRVETNASGLRVRSGPGTSQGVLALLPIGANLVIELGPVRATGHGWYLVRDADEDAPAFEEGWVAAGFMPNPYLKPATFELPFNPIVAGFAHDGDGEFGPVPVADANYSITWLATALAGASGCSFSVDLVPSGGTAVSAIRATLGTAPTPGNLYTNFFAGHPELIGDLLVRVTSDCGWALTFLRGQPVGE